MFFKISYTVLDQLLYVKTIFPQKPSEIAGSRNYNKLYSDKRKILNKNATSMLL